MVTVKVRPTYATRKALIERRIVALRNDAARYAKHGWPDEAEEAKRAIFEARAELRALVRHG